MADLTIVSSKIAPVQVIEQMTGPAGAALAPGDVVRLDTTTGKFVKAQGTAAPNAAAVGVVLTTAKAANQTVTVLRQGLLNVGDALTAAAFQASIYIGDTAGVLSDTAGTSTKVVGTVVPAWGAAAVDKLLRVDL